MKQVVELARPFPTKYVHDDGKGNAYVPHHIVTQRLIHIFGVTPKIEILREIYDKTPEGDKLTGVVMRLTVAGFEPIEEAGEADNPQAKTNGARLKSATSDAIKRCAMRLGLGLHLWAQKDYFLYDKLTQEGGVEAGTDNEGVSRVGEVHEAPVPASVKESGSVQEPGGDEATAVDSPPPADPPPATDLVEVYGDGKVLAAARRLAKSNNFLPQPMTIAEISAPLAALVGKELEKV